ncbi:interleukin-13 receptor subunit alpha-2 [Takifugu rubripes]|nr:interleukin-13 receptor subunit alpha-2 [Takifugu rubripes]
MSVGKLLPDSILSFPLMANKSWVIYQATLLLVVNLSYGAASKRFSALEPPKDLAILDPGFLGYLEIVWSPPANLPNATQCLTRYQLEYFDTYSGKWSGVRTPLTSHRVQFDLMKNVSVRVYTLLSGPCTNGKMITSKNYTELVYKPPRTGAANTEVQDFVCVNYNMMTIECTWQRGAKTPDNAQQRLYFWHKNLERAQECPKYIISRGFRSGCQFTGTSLPLFTDVNICVNGSSPEGPLQAKFISLQIQNHIKPPTTEKVDVRAGPDSLVIAWEHPVGGAPEHCLEWEVERQLQGPDGKTTRELTLTTQKNLTLPSGNQKEKNCFSVRSKLQNYCVEKGLWSDWSRPACLPEKTDSIPGAHLDISVYFYAVAVIASLVLFLCVTSAAFKVRKSASKPSTAFG